MVGMVVPRREEGVAKGRKKCDKLNCRFERDVPLEANIKTRLSHSHTVSYDCLIVRSVAIWRTCDRSAMFATIASSDRKLRSVFLPGSRSSHDWSYAWSRDQQRLEKIVRLVVAIDRGPRRSIVWSIASGVEWGVTWTPETSPHVIVSVSNRLVVPPVARWHDQWHD